MLPSGVLTSASIASPLFSAATGGDHTAEGAHRKEGHAHRIHHCFQHSLPLPEVAKRHLPLVRS